MLVKYFVIYTYVNYIFIHYLFTEAWDSAEDDMLTSLVDRFGTQTWTEIAQRLQNRSGKQCRERWHNHLDPAIRKVSFIYILIHAHMYQSTVIYNHIYILSY